jgi:hypothetical protein
VWIVSRYILVIDTSVSKEVEQLTFKRREKKIYLICSGTCVIQNTERTRQEEEIADGQRDKRMAEHPDEARGRRNDRRAAALANGDKRKAEYREEARRRRNR